MSEIAGRTCPIAYRYGAVALSRAPRRTAETLYVVGGLYGNPYALAALQAMAAAESTPVRICFNGDFNWFNIGSDDFRDINLAVLQADAILGNVEYELASADDTAGCGCAYPNDVDAGTVARSNRIHQRLKTTAQAHPDLLVQLAALPMYATYQVGDLRVGVVHGDAHSLAGWGFDVAALGDASNTAAIESDFAAAAVDVFASSHTCLPALRRFQSGIVINNGAAGMPNFAGSQHGVLTRISLHPAAQKPIYGEVRLGVYIDALPIAFDAAAWQAHFQRNWPAGSDAYLSYFQRICTGPNFSPAQACA